MKRLMSVFGSLALAAAIFPWNHADGAEVASRSNGVPNDFIKIDGNLSDWLNPGVTWYPIDDVGDGSTGGARPLDIDILQGAVANDENYIYVLYRNAGDNMVDGASNWVFFDTDKNLATGLAFAAWTGGGLDFNLGGTGGWNAWSAAGAFVGGGAGKTVAVGDSDGSGGADFLEYRISRTAAQPNGIPFNPANGTDFNLSFIAEDTTMDWSPNNSADWFNYVLGSYTPKAPGDANGVGGVDINDYLLIQAHAFEAVPFGALGDVTDDGFVDFTDFREWKENFPGGAAAADAAVEALGVPEPSTFALGGIGLLLLATFHRRRGLRNR